MPEHLLQKARAAARKFRVAGEVTRCEIYGNGHIHDTFWVVAGEHGKTRRYIMQRVNDHVFTKPLEVMENIAAITDYLRAQMKGQGAAPDMREVLRLVRTADSAPYHIDPAGHIWRMYDSVEGAISYDEPTSTEMVYHSACCFGTFFTMLAGYPAETLHETIPRFHDTPARYAQLEEAAARDAHGRAAGAQKELAFARARHGQVRILADMQKSGALPTRVTHNDTKLNNVLLDEKTGRGVCVIDLDTVMPGLSAYDFGDAIRAGASTCAEDERDLSKCGLSLPLYEAYAKGFLECAGACLTEAEVDALPLGAKMMTLECGMRFLADHLNGDEYFKIHRAGQNLDRCRTQFCLVADMERKWEQMQRAVALQYR